LATFPANNSVAEQLKIVSRLIHGGLKTKIYLVTQTGYDTHGSQVETDTTTGVHASLLKELSDGIAAFQADIELQGIADKIIGMTYSEFGRRANSNNSLGTDHGVAAPMFMFGTSLKKQKVGNNPNLSDLIEESGQYNLKMEVDFRQIYQDVLQDWFGVNQAKSQELIYDNFQTTSILSDVNKSVKSGDWTDATTWSLNRIPNLTEKVLIQDGHKVIVHATDNINCGYLSVYGVFETEPGAVFSSSN
jgi:uncharacterized protein (DUF1501 family)